MAYWYYRGKTTTTVAGKVITPRSKFSATDAEVHDLKQAKLVQRIGDRDPGEPVAAPPTKAKVDERPRPVSDEARKLAQRRMRADKPAVVEKKSDSAAPAPVAEQQSLIPGSDGEGSVAKEGGAQDPPSVIGSEPVEDGGTSDVVSPAEAEADGSSGPKSKETEKGKRSKRRKRSEQSK